VALRLWGAAVLASFVLIASTSWAQPEVFGDGIDSPEKADMILVVKHERLLYLLRDGQVMKSFHVMLGHEPYGMKIRQGDGRTPEGFYWIDKRNADSSYHLALHISYPDMEDVARAHRLGVVPGGNVMIHGLPNGYILTSTRELRKDWTDGCIAVTNHAIEEIWSAVDDGTPIEIKP
jgi:murein L,D-transpeptidase YafK